MPSVSKRQQNFFQVVYLIKKGKLPSSRRGKITKAGKVASSLSLSQIKDYLQLK